MDSSKTDRVSGKTVSAEESIQGQTTVTRGKSTPPISLLRRCLSVTPEQTEGRRLCTPEHGEQSWKSSVPVKRPSNSARLFSPVDSDQELNDLEVESVLADGPDPDSGQRYRSSSSKLSSFDTPAKLALSPFRPSTVMTNLQRGNVQTTTPSMLHHMSIHQMAAQGELLLLQQEIVDGSDLNRQDESGLTAIHWACAYGQQAAVEFLAQNGADITLTGNLGENSLLLASCNGYQDIVKYLLQNGMDVNYSDEGGNTALMYGAFNNHSSCIQVLLEHGANMTAVNEDHIMAFDLAVGQGHKAAQSAFERYMLSLFEHPP